MLLDGLCTMKIDKNELNELCIFYFVHKNLYGIYVIIQIYLNTKKK